MMDDSAVPPLARCLASEASHLTELWLGGNELTDDAAGVLAAALAEAGPTSRRRKLWLDRTDALTQPAHPALFNRRSRPFVQRLSLSRIASLCYPDSLAVLSG